MVVHIAGKAEPDMAANIEADMEEHGDGKEAAVMHGGHPLVEQARAYLRAIEEGATGERLRAFFADDAVVRTLPNRIAPEGSTRELDAVLAAAERGRGMITAQRYEERSAFVDGESVILEVEWTATMAAGPAPRLRAFFAMFLAFRDGRIVAQRNYDCFEPF